MKKEVDIGADANEKETTDANALILRYIVFLRYTWYFTLISLSTIVPIFFIEAYVMYSMNLYEKILPPLLDSCVLNLRGSPATTATIFYLSISAPFLLLKIKEKNRFNQKISAFVFVYMVIWFLFM